MSYFKSAGAVLDVLRDAIKAVTALNVTVTQVVFTGWEIRIDVIRHDCDGTALDAEMQARLRSRIVFDLGRLAERPVSIVDGGEMASEGATLSVQIAIEPDAIVVKSA